jgi:hypothetical protein
VLSWFDPHREPRIEWSRYVNRDDLLAALDDNQLLDRWAVATYREGHDLPSTLILVVASTEGIDDLTPTRSGRVVRWQDGACNPPTSPLREQVIAVFDPFSAARQGSWTGSWASPDRLAGLPSIGAAVSNDLRRPATATSLRKAALRGPTSTVAGLIPRQFPRLTQANLPHELRPTFSHYPLAPGSSWTWDITTRAYGVRWTASVMTETILAAWLENGMAVVESSIEERYQTRPYDDLGQDTAPRRLRRYVGKNAIADSVDGVRQADALAAVAPNYRRVPIAGVALEETAFPGFRRGIPESVTVDDDLVDVHTSAGDFIGCWSLTVQGSALWGSWRAFCPGVGYVQSDLEACGTHNFDEQANLLRWRRATLPVQ